MTTTDPADSVRFWLTDWEDQEATGVRIGQLDAALAAAYQRGRDEADKERPMLLALLERARRTLAIAYLDQITQESSDESLAVAQTIERFIDAQADR